jgi:hypothetical protein
LIVEGILYMPKEAEKTTEKKKRKRLRPFSLLH